MIAVLSFLVFSISSFAAPNMYNANTRSKLSLLSKTFVNGVVVAKCQGKAFRVLKEEVRNIIGRNDLTISDYRVIFQEVTSDPSFSGEIIVREFPDNNVRLTLINCPTYLPRNW